MTTNQSTNLETHNPQDDPILISTDEAGIRTITLNRPDKLNGVTAAMWSQLTEEFNKASADVDVRVVMIAANGRGFCAGADLWDQDRKAAPIPAQEAMRRTHACALALHRLVKPTVAKVNGVAAGAGANLALGCDLIVASTEARFSEIFVQRGLTLDFGGSWLLPQLIGLHKAKELAFLGEVISAEQANDFGLLNRLVAPDMLDESAEELCNRLASVPPLSLRASKQLLNQNANRTMAEALDAEANAQVTLFHSKDLQEAMAAYSEKRAGKYRGF